MIELGSVGKIKRALKLAKLAEVGMELSYFEVIELLGEIESLEETIRILDTRDDDELITAYRIDNADLKRKLANAEQKQHEAESIVERLIEAGERLSIHSRMVDDIDVWNALVAEWRNKDE